VKQSAKRRRIAEVKSGLKLAVMILAGFACCFVALAGVSIITSPARYPSAVGWGAIAVTLLFAIISVKKWVAALPSVFGLATLNSVLMLASGHLVNDPSKRVAPLTAAAMAVLLLASALLSTTMTNRSLTAFDRAALAFMLTGFLFGISADRWGIVGLAIVVSSLGLAVIRSRYGRARPASGR
jgi:hypothetical protein